MAALAAKWGEIRGSAALDAAAGHPEHEPPAPAAHAGQRGAVDALGGEHVDVVELRELFRGEGLGGAGGHVAGVVDEHVDPAGLGLDLRYSRVDGVLRVHVEFDGAQVDTVLAGVVGRGLDLRRVAARGVAHARVHGVAGVCQGPGGEGAETAGGTRDDDDVAGGGHGDLSEGGGCGRLSRTAAKGGGRVTQGRRWCR